MAWYDTGTVSVTNGSATVTGSGTAWSAAVNIGDAFYGPDDKIYEVQSVGSNTSITLADNYEGTTASGQSYKIVPTQGLAASLATDISTLISDFQTVVDDLGDGEFGNGSASAPSISFTSDTDTGMYRVSSNVIGFATSGSERLRIDSGGIDVTGGITSTAASSFTAGGATVATVISTLDTSVAGPNLLLRRERGTPAANDEIGNLIFQGRNSAGQNYGYVRLRAFIEDTTDGVEKARFLISVPNEAGGTQSIMQIRTDGTGGGLGEVVFNDSSKDMDFRVESDGSANMLRVDASTNRVGIGEAEPEARLHISNSSNGVVDLMIENTDTDSDLGPNLQLKRNSSSPATNDLLGRVQFTGRNSVGDFPYFAQLYVQADSVTDGSESGDFVLQKKTAGSNYTDFRINDTEVVFNESGRNLDFRVESDALPNFFKIDSATNTLFVSQTSSLTTPDTSTTVHFVTGNNSPVLKLESTDADNNDGPNVLMYRSSSSPANGDNLMTIDIMGKNSAGEDTVYAMLFSEISDVTDGSEAGQFRIYTRSEGSQYIRMEMNENETVFNEDSRDVNFRVESDTQANAFHIDGETGVTTFFGNLGKDRRSDSTRRAVVFNGSQTNPYEVIIYNSDTAVAGNQFLGAYLFSSADASGTPNHYSGMAAIADDGNGNMHLAFHTGSTNYETDPRLNAHMLLRDDGSTHQRSAGMVLGVLDGNYTASNESYFTAYGGASDTYVQIRGRDTTSASETAFLSQVGGAVQSKITMDGTATFTGLVLSDVTPVSDSTVSSVNNELSHFEEGEWEPEYQDSTASITATYDQQHGYYMVVGEMVFITGRLRTDAVNLNGATGTLYVDKLPFNSRNVTVGNSNGGITITNSTAFAGEEPTTGTINDATNRLVLRYRATSNGNFATSNVNDLGSTTNDNDISFFGMYFR
jgi:hypothetical protein